MSSRDVRPLARLLLASLCLYATAVAGLPLLESEALDPASGSASGVQFQFYDFKELSGGRVSVCGPVPSNLTSAVRLGTSFPVSFGGSVGEHEFGTSDTAAAGCVPTANCLRSLLVVGPRPI
jgi:hypothetical protein